MKITLSFLLIMIVFAISAFVGKVPIDSSALFDTSSTESMILFQLRIPRILMAFLSGGILALSGLLFQTLFRNPLTTPFTLGISSGATLGVAIAILLGFHESFWGFSILSLAAFVFALLSIFLIYFFSLKFSSTQDSKLILVGIALSFLFSSLLLMLYYLSSYEESYRIMRFTMGRLDTVGYHDSLPLLLASSLLLWGAYHYKDALRRLSISYEFAYLKGIDVEQMMRRLFILISLAIGILVSITGPIGFVGLIIPHILRFMLKKSIDALILPSFLFGGIFLVLCDTLARALPTLSEIPVGIITSLIGGTLFIVILIKRSF